ncbi:MAG TPA: hypothetical protein VNB28_04770 [Methylomirabilota bacterium]|nr:hypothetical protein [Methylomirabilota bacterium]
MPRLEYVIFKDKNGCRLRVGDEETGPLTEAEARRIALRKARALQMAGRTVAVVMQGPDMSLRTEWIGAPFGGRVEA